MLSGSACTRCASIRKLRSAPEQELQIALRDAHRFSNLEQQTRADVEELHRLLVHFGVNNIQELEYKIRVAEEGWQMGNIEIERLRHELEYNSGVEVDLRAAFTNLETDVSELQERKWKADAKIMKLEQQLEGATMALARKERELEAASHRMKQLTAQQRNQYQHLLAAQHGHGGPQRSLDFNQMPPPFSEKLLRNKMQIINARDRMDPVSHAPAVARDVLPPLNSDSPRAHEFAAKDGPYRERPAPLSFNVHSPPKKKRHGAQRPRVPNGREHLRELNHQQVMKSHEFTPKASNQKQRGKRGGRSPAKGRGAGKARGGAGGAEALEDRPRWM